MCNTIIAICYMLLGEKMRYLREVEGTLRGGQTRCPGEDGVESRQCVGATLLARVFLASVALIFPDLPALVSEGGGQGVLTLACLQDLSQARQRWGAAAEGFGSLFGATLVLPGIGDVRTLEAISVRCGSHDVWVRSESKGKNRTWSTRRQRRIEPDEISRGRPGHYSCRCIADHRGARGEAEVSPCSDTGLAGHLRASEHDGVSRCRCCLFRVSAATTTSSEDRRWRVI